MDILESLLKGKTEKLTKAQLRILNYIIENFDEAIFLNASKIGKKASVSESSVIRLAQALGFNGYPAMQRKLQKHYNYRVTTVNRLDKTVKDTEDPDYIFVKTIQEDINNLNETLRGISKDTFEQAITDMWSAQRIFIAGLKDAHAPASVLANSIGLFKKGVFLIEPKVGQIWDTIFDIGPDDLMIGISLPRYTRLTVEILEFSFNQGAKVGAITDSLLSPLASYASWLFEAKCRTDSFIESFTSTMSIVNALITGLGIKDLNKTTQIMKQREKIWKEKSVYYSREN